MYRIEVAPGEETVFRTIEELAVGIRNGVVTPRSRIYHNASQKWLPIGLHPHYKKALELPAASAAQPAAPAPVPSAPRVKPRAEPAPELRHERTPAPLVPAPVMSPVVAMQQEVLRDLPVVAIPDPLPWSTRAPEPAPRPSAPISAPPPPAPAPATHAPASIARIAQAVQSQPTATLTYTPRVTADPAPVHRPVEPHFEPRPEDLRESRPTARRSPRPAGRPLLLLGVAAVLAVGAHFALTAVRSASADTTAEPREEPEPAAETVSEDAVEPMMPGPAFAGSAPLRPGEAVQPRGSTAPISPPPAGAPSSDSATAAPAIAPPPVDLDLALPDLPTDSVVPKRSDDTLAMKKILRALNGAKPAEAPAAP